MSKTTTVQQSQATTRVGRTVSTIRDNWFSYALFVPTLLFLLLVLWIPFFRGIVMTFYEWPLGPGTPEFVGLENYRFLFSWDGFWTSVKATVLYASVTVFQLVIALAAALAIVRVDRFRSVISGVFLLPYTMPPVVIGTVWLFLLDPSLGPIFPALIDFGILQEPIYWGTYGDTALAAIVGVGTWTFWPFMFLIILATLDSIPEDYYESAQMYGATRFQRFRYVTLPQIKSAILVAVSIRMVWNLAKISQVYQLTQGGPGYETSILAVLLYRFGYEEGELGLGFTVGIVLFVITMLFVAVFIREFEKQRSTGGEAA
jgi:ABC-type sugar transport system permease subunit